MKTVSYNDDNGGDYRRIDYADVLSEFADGKKHRLADLAASMDLGRWNKIVLQSIASSLYRSGRLARLGEGVYRLARVEPPSAEVVLATESERMVDAAVAMLIALSPSERRTAITRAKREDEGTLGLPVRLATPDAPASESRPSKKDRLVDRVLARYDDGRPHRVSDVVDAVCESGASRGERRVVTSTIFKLKTTGLIVTVERGLHRRAEGAKPPAKPSRPTTKPLARPLVRQQSRGAANPDDHEDWPLVEAVCAGDARAEETMLRKHEGILHVVCRRFKSDKVPYDDLMQEARLGFLHGLRKAEKGRGGNPITYSIFWVRAFVGRYFENHSSDVRVPNHLHGKKRRQSADGMKLLHSVSMEQPLPGSDGERTYEDTFRAPPTAPDDDEVIEAARYEVLRLDMRKLVDRLPAREAAVIRNRFLADGEPTLDEVGTKLGLSGERVRQIQNDALARLGRLRDRDPIEPIAATAVAVVHRSSRVKSKLGLARAKAPRLDERSLGPLVTKPPARRSS